ncbi:membrane protein CcdC involved in cytochrome C biogenesis [Pseudarthrobacter defluvii]|uniref:hypothetical protein n=1 Tax=Pseudarthrobacter defluvii TaxID=410837 RepID=UPI0027881CB9|nr:hypothetical protein [Pseudarthrobacter defluvii]MDQ0769412.1 membrane protein CcdC involved in cytochrome C biogenesis [Pseudarthrobacter defluvii]
MTTTQWLLNAGLLIFILATNLGTRPVTRRRLILPIILAAVAGILLLSNIPTGGNDLALDYIGAGAGIALGILAALLMRVERNPAGQATSTAGAPYALLWLLVIGGRVTFAESANGWAAAGIRDFSISNAITGADAWTAAFIIMALTMVAARVITTYIRYRALPARVDAGTPQPVRGH